MFGSVFKSFSLPTTGSQSMSQLGEWYLSVEAGVWHFDTVTSPAELILHDHSLDAGCIGFSEDAGCIGFSEDAGVGATVFPSDVKHFSEATLMECLQGLQVTSISNIGMRPLPPREAMFVLF